MKIIHCADLHLDSKMQSNFHGDKAKQRKVELLETFSNMVFFAKKNEVQAIIIAGDMFDTARISLKTKEIIYDLIKNNPLIDFIFLSGNHDEDNVVLEFENLSNLKVFDDSLQTFSYGDIDISGIQLNKSNKTFYDVLNLDKSKTNILVVHGQIDNYRNKNDAQYISLHKLKNKNIDYLALGHIHSYSEGIIDERGIYVYSGCLEGRGFDECGEKGFVLLDIEESKITKQFVPFAKRKLHEIDFDISNYSNWFDIERSVISSLNIIQKSDLIKLVLKGRYSLDLQKIPQHLENLLNNEFFFAKIEDKSNLKIDPLDYINDKSLKGEFIRVVLNSDLKDEEKEKIIVVGIGALNGEEK